ncbi:MAG: diaminopimelate decarboxylase [Oscillospiraceae bacterium]|nr:diaminopimelate decarboxylase [Oscillospiraceae bacterium]
MKIVNSMETKEDILYIAGVSCLDLAQYYGTPLYVMNEEIIRKKCKEYRENFIDKGFKVCYAGKAFLTMYMCKIIHEEGLGLDVVSGGELYTAIKAGFPLEKIYFHGNNKSLDEIEMAVKYSVGRIVVDNFYELEMLESECKKQNKIQNVLLRVSPGIDAHTHEYVKTAGIDTKFGFTIIKNKLKIAIDKAVKSKFIRLAGIHCHIGSQIFEIKPFKEEVHALVSIIKDIKDEYDYDVEEINLGGGFGIYYSNDDDPLTIKEICDKLIEFYIEESNSLNIAIPKLVIEPGRSIVGEAGTTLYKLGAVKEIEGIKKYISVDGGMGDNIRPALYNAKYECAIANRMTEGQMETITISGKCCESGDILLESCTLNSPKPNDILAVFATGAYCFSMASQYNRNSVPSVVFVKDKTHRLSYRRLTYEEMLHNEI